MEDKVRLSDIASEPRLSTAAVSYVLHGKPVEPVVTLSTTLAVRDSTR